MSEEIVSAITRRRSIRNYLKKPVPQNILSKSIDAARWAPSSCNRQSVKFLIVSDKKRKDLIIDVSSGGKGFANLAPHLIVVLSDLSIYNLPYERNLAYVDSALAAQNLMLQAHEDGLGTCYLNWALPNPETDAILYSELGIPNHMVIVGVITIGFPDKSVKFEVSERKPIEEYILSWE